MYALLATQPVLRAREPGMNFCNVAFAGGAGGADGAGNKVAGRGASLLSSLSPSPSPSSLLANWKSCGQCYFDSTIRLPALENKKDMSEWRMILFAEYVASGAAIGNSEAASDEAATAGTTIGSSIDAQELVPASPVEAGDSSKAASVSRGGGGGLFRKLKQAITAPALAHQPAGASPAPPVASAPAPAVANPGFRFFGHRRGNNSDNRNRGGTVRASQCTGTIIHPIPIPGGRLRFRIVARALATWIRRKCMITACVCAPAPSVAAAAGSAMVSLRYWKPE